MTERHPLDTELLAAASDPTTGVEYIPTGTSPYVIEFRRMINRILRAFERANDLRVYQDGDATFGVRPGRCRINDTPISFAGVTKQALAWDTTTYVWIDQTATIQTSTSSFPATATTHLPLAVIHVGIESITSLEDRRGEVFLQSPTASTLGITATADEINQALDGIAASVSATTLTLLTAGPDVSVDLLHRHVQSAQNVAGTASFSLINDTTEAAGNFALVFSLPNLLSHDTVLELNNTHHWLQQRRDNVTYNLLGSIPVQTVLQGDLTGSLTNQLLGIVPVTGRVTGLILSVADNTISDDSADGLRINLKVNDTSILTTEPEITAGDGSGFRSTDQGNGTVAVIPANATAEVTRGDMLSFDLTYNANGNITSPPRDVVIAAIIRASQPE